MSGEGSAGLEADQAEKVAVARLGPRRHNPSSRFRLFVAVKIPRLPSRAIFLSGRRARHRQSTALCGWPGDVRGGVGRSSANPGGTAAQPRESFRATPAASTRSYESDLRLGRCGGLVPRDQGGGGKIAGHIEGGGERVRNDIERDQNADAFHGQSDL